MAVLDDRQALRDRVDARFDGRDFIRAGDRNRFDLRVQPESGIAPQEGGERFFDLVKLLFGNVGNRRFDAMETSGEPSPHEGRKGREHEDTEPDAGDQRCKNVASCALQRCLGNRGFLGGVGDKFPNRTTQGIERFCRASKLNHGLRLAVSAGVE